MEISFGAEAVGVVGIATDGGEEGEVPIFDYVPVKGVHGVYEDGEKPGVELALWSHEKPVDIP